jgi:uncharacterized protein
MTATIPLSLGSDGTAPRACTTCGQCCTYVAVGINAPRRSRYATDILWFLYHDRVSVWRDSDGEWSVLFETRCRNLDDGLLCRIYENRPEICRSFDNTTCEVNAPGGGRCFTSPQSFLEYLEAEEPKVYRKVTKTHVPPALRGKPARGEADSSSQP